MPRISARIILGACANSPNFGTVAEYDSSAEAERRGIAYLLFRECFDRSIDKTLIGLAARVSMHTVLRRR